MAVLILAEADLLPLHEPVASHWPDWPGGWVAITPHDLLSHTAGIPDYTTRADFPAAWLPAIEPKRLIETLGPLPLATKLPAYSNSHYVLLGELVARVSGRAYADFIGRHIIAPAGARDTQLRRAPRATTRHAVGYTSEIGHWLEAGELPPGLLEAAGGFSSTADDLHRIHRALVRSNGMLSEVGRARLWAVQGNASYGWVATGSGPARTWICSGKVRGFSAAMIYRAHDDRFGVVLSNRDDAPVLEICSDLMTLRTASER